MRMVMLDAYSFNPGDLSWDGLSRFGEISVYDATPSELVVDRLKGAQVAFVNRVRLGEAEFSALPELRFVSLFATGSNMIDKAAARRHGIVVSNVPDYATESVAEHTFALLLETCFRAGAYDRAMRQGRWKNERNDCTWDHSLIELCGKTFGVIGTGSIGCAAGRIAAGFGMRVIGWSRTRRDAFIGEYVPLKTLLSDADVVSLHLPASAETAGLIDREAIQSMKQGAILINTARGALVDTEALCEALNLGRLSGAGIDVYQTEPLPESDPLLQAKNCVLTPHIAWIPRSARERLMRASEENLAAFLDGKPIHRVDLEE